MSTKFTTSEVIIKHLTSHFLSSRKDKKIEKMQSEKKGRVRSRYE